MKERRDWYLLQLEIFDERRETAVQRRKPTSTGDGGTTFN
jgi:hypothetical protein